MTEAADRVVWPEVLSALLAGRDLDEEHAGRVLREVMRGEAEPAQVAGLLVALRAKGEADAEIAGFVRAMLDHAEPIAVEGPLLDTCGTGGDGAGTFNISTVTALVCAAAGVRVAKHGNRAASGTCGSADLLEAWGVEIDLPPSAVATTIDELGIGFLYARSFHPAMRHVGPVRVQLGVRTVFNVLGPLSNPARARYQVVGVSDLAMAPVMARALGRLGAERALVCRSDDGLDELTTTATNRTWEVQGGEVEECQLDPRELGLPRATIDDLRGGGVEDNVRIADAVLSGQAGPKADVVVLNTAAALHVAGRVADLPEGIELARRTLESGAAAELKQRWVERTRELAKPEGDGTGGRR